VPASHRPGAFTNVVLAEYSRKAGYISLAAKKERKKEGRNEGKKERKKERRRNI